MNAPPAIELVGNTSAEAALCGVMMRENRIIDSVADLVQADDFTEEFYAHLFGLIVREHSMGKVANPVTLRPFYADKESVAFLASLTGNLEGAEIIGVRDMARQIADLAKRRRLIEGLHGVIASAQAWEDPVESLVEQIDGTVNEAMREGEGSTSLSASKCIGLVADGFNDSRQGVTCHAIPTVDHCLGSIRPGDMVVLAARPAMGKTAVALSYAIGAAKAGHGVLFASLEMRAEQLGGRMAADILFDGRRVPYQRIVEATVNAEERREVARASVEIENLPLQVEDLPSVTIGKLNTLVRRNARRMAAKGQKLELVIVDYLQLVRPDHREASPYAAISEVSRGLKAMAKTHGVGVLALAQLSREVEKRADKRPQLSDLRDSGQIEQDADAIMFLLRHEEYLMRERPDETSEHYAAWSNAMRSAEGRIEFIVAKRRNGRTGIGVGQWFGEYQAVRG